MSIPDNDSLFDDNDSLFADDLNSSEEFGNLFANEAEDSDQSQSEEKWRILIVDDEPDIHQAIKFALDDFKYDGKGIEFLDAYSSEEAKVILSSEKNIATVLLDVVMETNDAGLNFVKFIREELKNEFVRVVLWTGQPGQAPQKDVVVSYEINDYKTKTELKTEVIFTTVLASLRAYNTLITLENFRQSLEDKVKERTAELQIKNQKIEDSINYAKRIQESILPSEKIIKKYIPDSFIVYIPKDIVSGDFYWFSEYLKDKDGDETGTFFIAAADCTGHGVPGAFMSMIGSTLLNEIVNGKHITDPAEILKELNKGVINALNQRDEGDSQYDGMDITLCKVDPLNNNIEVSCANHDLFVIDHENDTISELEGDIFSIGGIFSVLRTPKYSNHSIQMSGSKTLYMFSDGFQDQFGGDSNQKFSRNNFKKLLFSVRDLPMEEQKERIIAEFNDWKKNTSQIDDILIIGLQFK